MTSRPAVEGLNGADRWRQLVARLEANLGEYDLDSGERRAAATGLADLWDYAFKLAASIWAFSKGDTLPPPDPDTVLDAQYAFAQIAVALDDIDLHLSRLHDRAHSAGRVVLPPSFPTRAEREADVRAIVTAWGAKIASPRATAHAIVELRGQARAIYDLLADPGLIMERASEEGRRELVLVLEHLEERARELRQQLAEPGS